MAELVITLTDGRKTRHKLTDRPQVMGRDAQCDIPIDDPSTSRRHARFVPTPDGYAVEDLGSKNGTLVNDESCTRRELCDGDRVTLGSVVAVYQLASRTSATSVVLSDDMGESRATRYLSRDQELNISQQRLRLIYELSDRLTTLQSREQLLETAMDIGFQTLHFERGAIGVRRVDQRTLDWPVVRNLRGDEGELCISRSLLGRALQHGERAIFTDAGPGQTDPTVSMVQHGIRSAMCVPMISHDKTIGVIYGDRTSTSTPYNNEDIDFLAGIAQQVTIGLINCRLVDEQQEMARLQRDVELARTIQTGLFPADLPSRPDFKVAALNDPGQRVSGDYYDVVAADKGCIWCVIADVTGEGVAASLIMANLQAVVRATIEGVSDPSELLCRWNKQIYHNTDSSKFVTCLLALIDPAGKRIHLAAAGHCRPILVRGGGLALETVDCESNYPLGVIEDASFPAVSVDTGDDPYVFFTYTDGVIEAMNAQGDQFGMDRLHAVLEACADLNPQALIKQVRKSVTQHADGAQQSDDITILAARVG
ncbi:MAG: SpoIIE family protein phosphatase [Planctomycetes bacterium]|nr:SpoIIE family protein phosphatase [Planctomycetota bacterium]